MPRSTVSIDEDQDAWIRRKADSLDVSKSKIIRECIEAARNNESLLTTSVNTDDDDISDTIDDFEVRLSALERLVAEQSSSPASRPKRDPESSPSQKARSTHSKKAEKNTETDHPSSSSSTPTPLDGCQAPPSGGTGSETSQQETPPTEPDSSTNGSSGVSSEPEGSTTEDSAEPKATQSSMPDASSSRSSSAGKQQDKNEDGDPQTPPTELSRSDPEAVANYLESQCDNSSLAAAVFMCWQKLNQRGTEHVRAFKAIHEEYPLGYDSPDRWWEDAIQPELVSLPGVEPPEGGGNLYRFKY